MADAAGLKSRIDLLATPQLTHTLAAVSLGGMTRALTSGRLGVCLAIVGAGVMPLAGVSAEASATAMSAAAMPTGAAPATRLYDDISDRYRVKPARFGYGGRSPDTNFGANFTFKKVSWKGWGRPTARGRGMVRVCPNMAPCVRRRVRLVASVRRRPCAESRVYLRLRATFARPLFGSSTRRFDLSGVDC